MNSYRILTYNVRRCLGMDGALSPMRIAEVIGACRADIVALQELDVGRARSDNLDQAKEIADALQMYLYFHPAFTILSEKYGDAILTTRPSRLIKAGALPALRGLEPRGALWVCVDLGPSELHIVNTHLGLNQRERQLQVDCLIGPEWIGGTSNAQNMMLVGDFNALPNSRVYRKLVGILKDTQGVKGRVSATFPSALPLLRLDYAFASSSIDVLDAKVVRSPLTRVASDHLPLLVDFEVQPPARLAASP